VAGQVVYQGASDRSDQMEPLARVLHIEDDRSIADMYAIGLELHGFVVLKAADGLAGLQSALTEAPDFLVIDVGLPRLNGLEVLAHLRKDPRTADLPALLLTAFNPQDYREQAASLGVEQVLLKSETTPAGLAATIRQRLIRAA